jgi:3-hydroxyisobutyrate dehydrogenase-like beta-hydroxyacid dehydrogenase
MGTAIARTLLRAGLVVTVFNRTKAKAEALTGEGAQVAPTVASALRASPLAVLCVADYPAAHGLVDGSDVQAALHGVRVVHLSTGTPLQARAFALAMDRAGAGYLDGAILVTPSQIGTPGSALLVAGKEEHFRATAPTLRMIGAQLYYVGEDPGSAAALDLAFLSHFFGGLLGFYHGARIMEAENLPVTKLGEMIESVAPALGAIVHADARRIAADQYDNPESSLGNSATVVELIRAHAMERNLDLRFPEFSTNLFRAGLKAGHAKRDVAALMRVLRAVNGGSR